MTACDELQIIVDYVFMKGRLEYGAWGSAPRDGLESRLNINIHDVIMVMKFKSTFAKWSHVRNKSDHLFFLNFFYSTIS